ncbi:MAG: hypothetical protein B6244_13535 [Candidatus Cloacimonetes bacterium 4572_55]|nr:MAG: hypothetical protein B6244_13535 [Candidatus Cloacimonetes bacterium 4572_55]
MFNKSNFYKILSVFFITVALTLIHLTANSQSLLRYLYEQQDWIPGSWAEYEVKNLHDGKETVSRIKISILSSEKVDGTTLYDVEIVTRSDTGDVDKMKVKMPKKSREEMKASSSLRELVVQHNDNQPVRLSLKMNFHMPQLDALEESRPPIEETVSELGTENVETKAGKFECRHIQKKGKRRTEKPKKRDMVVQETGYTDDVWLSDLVCLGVIKGNNYTETTMTLVKNDPAEPLVEQGKKTSESHYLLVDYGDSGAKSEIFGEPVDMGDPPSPPGINQGMNKDQ